MNSNVEFLAVSPVDAAKNFPFEASDLSTTLVGLSLDITYLLTSTSSASNLVVPSLYANKVKSFTSLSGITGSGVKGMGLYLSME